MNIDPEIVKEMREALEDKGMIATDEFAEKLLQWEVGGGKERYMDNKRFMPIFNSPHVRLAWMEPECFRDERKFRMFLMAFPVADFHEDPDMRTLLFYRAMSERGKERMRRWILLQPWQGQTDREATIETFINHSNAAGHPFT